jgi:pimeloyl-ACP methyl ester carboxylesterase
MSEHNTQQLIDELSLNDNERDNEQDSEISSEAANSIIGGESLMDDEDVTQQELEQKSFKNENKVFTFTLPFGGNPLAHLPSIKQLKGSLPIIGNNDDEGKREHNQIKDEIRNKLKRQETISTIEEAYLYKNNRGIDNSRIRAIRRTFTPSISIPSLIDEKKKFEPTVWDELEGEVVILGGYRGSILRDSKTNRRVWIPLRAGFNIKKINLLIGPTDEDEANAQQDIYADDMMTHLGPVDIAKKLRAKLNNGKTKVHTFGYDWRLSPDINSQKLFAFLQGLECNKSGTKKKGAIVIAHSMGGLISHHAMQKDPALFRGLLYVGVPAMCPNILGPLRSGDNVLFSSRILTAEANFFMRSSFVFLPRDGRCFIDRNTNEQYNLDYFDPQTWVDYNLSPLVAHDRQCDKKTQDDSQLKAIRSPLSPLSPIFEISDMKRSLSLSRSEPEQQFHYSVKESLEYLDRTLKRTKKFLDELEYDTEQDYPPLAIVYGNEVPTVRGCRVEGPQGIIDGDYADFYYGPGDGVVHHKWLMPERRDFPVVAKFASPLGHISLMTDLPVMGEALSAIIMEEKARENDFSA